MSYSISSCKPDPMALPPFSNKSIVLAEFAIMVVFLFDDIICGLSVIALLLAISFIIEYKSSCVIPPTLSTLSLVTATATTVPSSFGV